MSLEQSSLQKIQSEVKEWSFANFGEQPYMNPLLGVGEEIGELIEAKKLVDVNDALADMVIFAMDFCNRSFDWSITECIDLVASKPLPDLTGGSIDDPLLDTAIHMQVQLGRLHHAVLKIRQGIRLNEDHHTNGMRAIGFLYRYGDMLCRLGGVPSLESEVAKTWEMVKNRDWSSAKVDGIKT
jgi:hypothetical protein